TCPAPRATVGIVTVGKAHLDTMEALSRLGVDTVTANAPVRIYKPGLTWPLDGERLLDFARGLSHILVIEEKGAVVESQIKDLLFNRPDRPSVIGKKGFDGETMVPSAGQLRPSLLAQPLAGWLTRTA
ncbi:indolepyruvate ferredoxin oxidoreductase family protein, partial [Klebsiella pneumoniae]